MKRLTTRRLTLLTILSALCISIQLTPRPIPNVELTSLLVFLVGVFFGILVGSAVGTVVMFINGFLSSWGFAGLMLPFQIAGMITIGAVGGLYGQSKKINATLVSFGEAAILGAFLTLVFDIITNLGFAILLVFAGTPVLPAVVTAVVSGVPFLLVHVTSNFFIFLIAFLPLVKILQEFFGGENAWKRDSSPM